MGERLDGDSKGPSQTKICNFEASVLINEKILGLEIPVDDPPGVAVVDSVDELEHEHLDLVLGDDLLVLRHVLLQVVVQELEDEMKLLISGYVDHLLQPEFIMDLYFTMLGWGCSYFRIEISLMAVEGTP